MSHSERDGRIVISLIVNGNERKKEVLSHKDATFDRGGSAAQQIGAGRVVFISQGANKPSFSFMCTSGMEASDIADMLTDENGLMRPCTVTYSLRRSGVGSLSYRFEKCILGEGGGIKASDGEGVQGDKALKFLPEKAFRSKNGSAPRRAA